MTLSALPARPGTGFGPAIPLPASHGVLPFARSGGRLQTWPAPASQAARWPMAARSTPAATAHGSASNEPTPGSADTHQAPARALVLDGVTWPASGAALTASGASVGLSARFEPGQLHVISGATETDRAALLALLALTQRPVDGAVRWGEDDLAGLDEPARAAWRRANLGLVCPTARLVSVMTVAEHLRLASALRSAGGRHAQELEFAQALGLGQRLGLLPTDLTATERQALAISQALCFGPRVLLADDPAATGDAAQDAHFAATVAASLRDYARTRDAIVICLSDDAELCGAADTVLDFGHSAAGTAG